MSDRGYRTAAQALLAMNQDSINLNCVVDQGQGQGTTNRFLGSAAGLMTSTTGISDTSFPYHSTPNAQNSLNPIVLTQDKQSDLVSLVECPVCTYIPDTPVYGCKNGHHICKACRKKLTKCPLCSAEFSDTRLLFAEHVIALLTFKCEFQGCDSRVSGDNHRHHIQNCQYRPVPCHSENIKKCEGNLIPFVEYEKHLKQVHLTFGYEVEHDCYEFYHSFSKLDIKTNTISYMKYENKFFLLHVSEQKKGIYSWISIVEPETGQETKYQASLTYYIKTSNRARCVWQIFIHNFRKTFDEMLETGDLVGLQKDLLIPSCITNSTTTPLLGKRKHSGYFEWRVTVRIRRIDSTGSKNLTPTPQICQSPIPVATTTQLEADQSGSSSSTSGHSRSNFLTPVIKHEPQD